MEHLSIRHGLKINDIHNCYLQILCETGIIGIIPFIVILLISFMTAIKKLRVQNSDGIRYSFAYFLFFWLYAVSEPCLFQDSYFILLFLCIGEIVWNTKSKWTEIDCKRKIEYD